MKFQAPLSSVTVKPDEAIRIIADNLIATRPAKEVTYRPYRKTGVYYDTESSAGISRVDLKRLYPDAKPGNVVYVSVNFDSCDDYEGFIRFVGSAKVFLDGKEIFDTEREPNDGNRYSVPFTFRKGENNPVTFMVRCTSAESFTFDFMASVRMYWMWAKWYLLNVLSKCPLPEYRGEEGVAISRLYEREEPFDGKYVFPSAPEFSNTVDFDKIYPDAKGRIAYALTYATADTTLSISTATTSAVFVNGIEVADRPLALKTGDTVLVKLLRTESWSFDFDGENIGIPHLDSNRQGGDRWLTVGSFARLGVFSAKYGPEYDIRFTDVYRNEMNEKLFWKLAYKDDYMRPYLQSRFFGQWFYALMVGTHGLLRASEAVGEQSYKDYFVNSTELMSTFYNYAQYEREQFGRPAFLECAAFPHDLDSVGSMGRNMCELYNIHPTPETLNVINSLALVAKHNIPRFEDGTYHRPRDMWADDTFMSCPFIVRLGNIKGDRYYYEEVIRQLLGFKSRLWIADEQIMSHIFFLDTNQPNGIPWGRGNGWVYVTLTDALENIPEGFPEREKLMDFFLEFTKGVVRLQDSDGLWHQVLNRHDSYQETSCTGMFLLGLCRGIKNGWIDRETYMPAVERAYRGLIDKKISSTGNVYDVCMGSGNAKVVEYYMNLGAVDNDDHGTGVILTAIAEMMKIL